MAPSYLLNLSANLFNVSNIGTDESFNIDTSLSDGCVGSISKNAPPAFKTASMPMIKSIERSRHIAAVISSFKPRLCKLIGEIIYLL